MPGYAHSSVYWRRGEGVSVVGDVDDNVVAGAEMDKNDFAIRPLLGQSICVFEIREERVDRPNSAEMAEQ
eukprot:2859787-Amphidinium_carterae.1